MDGRSFDEWECGKAFELEEEVLQTFLRKSA
jgi:hypothetical protein